MIRKRKIALPRYAEYNCALKYVVEQGFEETCILPPPLTKRTEELGAKTVRTSSARRSKPPWAA